MELNKYISSIEILKEDLRLNLSSESVMVATHLTNTSFPSAEPKFSH